MMDEKIPLQVLGSQGIFWGIFQTFLIKVNLVFSLGFVAILD